MPFYPNTIGDGFNGICAATLEYRVVEAIQTARIQDRARVRSFDHRSLLAVQQIEAGIQTGLLIHSTAPAQIASLLDDSQAELYCPDYHFVDVQIIRQVHAAGKRIIPYTVNEPDEWERLIAWGVDGVTTDFPDRLLRWIKERD